MKPISVPVLVVLWLFLGLSPQSSHAQSWQVHASDHFQVFFAEDSAYAVQVSRTAERLYHRLQVELGFDRAVKKHHLFWLWKDRCRIYIYRNRAEYLAATGAPDWSSGFVKSRVRIVSSFHQAETFLESVLPHEVAHVMFRELVGYDNPRVPKWLDEGVAQFAETLDCDLMSDPMVERVARGIYLPLSDLSDVQLRWSDNETARLFYDEAESLVRFLLRRYGSGRFVEFCSNLRVGYSVERALSLVTGSSLASLQDLEEAWLRSFR